MVILGGSNSKVYDMEWNQIRRFSDFTLITKWSCIYMNLIFSGETPLDPLDPVDILLFLLEANKSYISY